MDCSARFSPRSLHNGDELCPSTPMMSIFFRGRRCAPRLFSFVPSRRDVTDAVLSITPRDTSECTHVQEHLPRLFFRQHERDKGGHVRARAAVFQNPEQFTVGSCGLPRLIRKISGKLSLKTRDLSQAFPVPSVTRHAKGLAVKNLSAFFDIVGRRGKRIAPRFRFFDVVGWDARLENRRISPQNRRVSDDDEHQEMTDPRLARHQGHARSLNQSRERVRERDAPAPALRYSVRNL